jgi:phosphoglycerate dehydrogenase-like enzyme
MLDFPQVAVHNLHHNAVAAAEMAVALMLAASKFIVPNDRALRRHDWTPRYLLNPAVVLSGQTVLILGYGSIGRRVAAACRGLGMRVIATRRSPSAEHEQGVYPDHAVAELLPQADVLVIALPLTDETEGLIGEEELAMLPARSVLVNVGRGPIVDEASLYAALRDGVVHAAGLDVWYNYPRDEASRSDTPPSDYPFHRLDNVVLSPHRAGGGGSVEIERRRMRHLAELLNTALAGREMANRVDVETGY